jgi:hypothetical protein
MNLFYPQRKQVKTDLIEKLCDDGDWIYLA